MRRSGMTSEALGILGDSVRVGRLRRGWSQHSLAERLGVSRSTVQKIERGDPGVAVGTVFEAAALVGVPLFSDDASERARFGAYKRTELELLPDAARERTIDDYDF